MKLLEIIALLLVATAAAVYLYRVYIEYRKRKEEAALFERTWNSPTHQLAKLLGDERRRLPPEEYKAVEKQVFELLEQNKHTGTSKDSGS